MNILLNFGARWENIEKNHSVGRREGLIYDDEAEPEVELQQWKFKTSDVQEEINNIKNLSPSQNCVYSYKILSLSI